MTSKLAPIYSTLEEDPALSDAIDDFVVGLGEWIDALQDAYAVGDLATVRQGAEDHADEAEGLGYPGLADGARQVAEAAKDGNAENTRKAIGGLIELVQRIRLGHRTAA